MLANKKKQHESRMHMQQRGIKIKPSLAIPIYRIPSLFTFFAIFRNPFSLTFCALKLCYKFFSIFIFPSEQGTQFAQVQSF